MSIAVGGDGDVTNDVVRSNRPVPVGSSHHFHYRWHLSQNVMPTGVEIGTGFLDVKGVGGAAVGYEDAEGADGKCGRKQSDHQDRIVQWSLEEASPKLDSGSLVCLRVADKVR